MNSFIKGVGTGAIIGMAVIIGGKMLLDDDMKCFRKNHMRKKLCHAARNASHIMNNVSHILG